MHGKVSRVRHDNRGCFKGIPQGIKSIRYHSLSASLSTLPSELAITSVTEESGVIMGVRHRKYTIEAVQYHPESILSEGGDDLIRNFLSLRGGLWEQNPEVGVTDQSLPAFPVEALPKDISSNPAASKKVPSILDKIYAQRIKDVAQAQETPGATLSDLETLYALQVTPSLIPFVPRIRQVEPGRPALFAEIKRASPSKGKISVTTSPAAQALKYALSGAHLISVLTEPKWFLGSLQDMLHARMAVANLPNRPAILRKDFILSRYQVLESRIWGADTILLIVSMLPEALLRDLYSYSLELGMEPLVEVNNAKEMEIALSLNAKVIGVNNRNLHDFNVDMNTTSRLADMVKGHNVTLAALSGISTPEDIKRYAAEGVGAVLIGESLMRADDPARFIQELFSIPQPPELSPKWRSRVPLVKICGVRSTDEAVAIAKAGADMIGLMFVEKSKRYVDLETAKGISKAVRDLRFDTASATPLDESEVSTPWFTNRANRLTAAKHPLLVGVFQNAPLAQILKILATVELDAVQLHGNEPEEWARQIPVPVIRVFHVSADGKGLENITRGGAHDFILLDSVRDDGLSGGSGKVVDLDLAKRIVDAGEIPVLSGVAGSKQHQSETTPTAAKTNAARYPLPIILAGGLSPENISKAIETVRPWAVDVSGGVENAEGTGKDLNKVQAFIEAAKGLGAREEEAAPVAV